MPGELVRETQIGILQALLHDMLVIFRGLPWCSFPIRKYEEGFP